MSTLGTLLCALAVLTAQVPLIACDSDCHTLLVSATTEHECHIPGAHAPDAHPSCVGHAHHNHAHQGFEVVYECGHEGCDSETPDHDGGEHEVIQVPAVHAGVRLILPAYTTSSAALVIATALLPASGMSQEASHAGDTDPLPVPPPASVRLLL